MINLEGALDWQDGGCVCRGNRKGCGVQDNDNNDHDDDENNDKSNF